MSNYDFGPDPHPDEKAMRDAKSSPPVHCGKAGEHKSHVYGTVYNRGEGPRPHSRFWATYEAPPYFLCPGTPPRTETWKGMKIYFHDDGKGTWAGNKR